MKSFIFAHTIYNNIDSYNFLENTVHIFGFDT